jgi:hypothetical protein
LHISDIEVSGFRFQVSGVRCQEKRVSGFRFQEKKVSGVRCQVSGKEGFRCQVSGVRKRGFQVSGVRMNLSGSDILEQGRNIRVCRFGRRSVWDPARGNAFVETPYYNAMASEISLLIADT